MAQRLLHDWLETYYKRYIIRHESPENFHLWNGIHVLSCAIRRNVYLDLDTHRIYPNLYMFLIAESGLCRKSVATEIGVKILQEVQLVNKDIVCIYEKATVEGLMDRMRRTTTIGTKIVPDGSVCIFADELANLFCKASYAQDLISFLTAAYSCRSKLEFTTRNKGICEILNACICLHANCTPEQLGDIFHEISKTSGFLGRVVVVSGDSDTRIARPKLKGDLKQSLIEDLYSVSKLYGEIKMDAETDKLFDSWYESLPKIAPNDIMPAFWERYHDFVLKISIILSISESNELIIKKRHFEKSVVFVNHISKGMTKAMRFIGVNETGLLHDRILKAISSARRKDGATRKEIMTSVGRHVQSSEHLSAILQVMEESGQIEVSVSCGNQTVYYRLKR